MAASSPQWSHPSPPSGPLVDAEAYALGMSLRSLVDLGCATTPRSLQGAIGASEAGQQCDRRLAYQLSGTPRVNPTDPLRAFVGTGVHMGLAELFTRMGAGSSRFLIERHTSYRGIPGTVDLYDRLFQTVIDWKTTTVKKLNQIRADGPPSSYITQIQIYGAGLRTAGEEVTRVALAYIPVDGALADLWVWRTQFDLAMPDAAADRIERLRGKAPADVPSTPDRLCRWCPFYRPNTNDIPNGCPGTTGV